MVDQLTLSIEVFLNNFHASQQTDMLVLRREISIITTTILQSYQLQ